MREVGKIAEGGRIVIPVRMRKALGLAKHDAVWIAVVDGELRIRPARSALRRIQAQLKTTAPAGRAASEELVADRRIEAARE